LRKLRNGAAWLAIFAAGGLVGWQGMQSRRAGLLDAYLRDARRAAVAIDAAELRTLDGSGNSAAPDRLTDRFRALADADERLRAIRLYRVAPGAGTRVLHPGVTAGDETPPAGEVLAGAAQDVLEAVARTAE